MKKDQFENILIAKSISPTAMRILVLRFLMDQKSAITLSLLENKLENTDRITLYRTLKTFEKKGLIHTIKDGTITRYALCEPDCNESNHADTHLHFYCTKCNETFCLSEIKLPSLNIPANFKMQELSIVARGMCNQCSQQTMQ